MPQPRPCSSRAASSCACRARSSTRCRRSPSPRRSPSSASARSSSRREEIAELCARLDSLPLAVELAAARTKALSPAQILERLSQRLDLLKGGRDADPRQQTLRATIEWSYDLLSAEEKLLFARLSVFAGGCTLEAAEEVADADVDTLQSLVEKSLVRFSDERYWMLETISEYAREQLESFGESAALGIRHAESFRKLAEAANLTAEAESGRRYDTAIREQENLRAAIDWCVARGEIELGLEIAVALENFWATANPLEGIRRLETLLYARTDLPWRLRARALRVYGGTNNLAGRHEAARDAYEESLALFRKAGSERDVAVLLHRLGGTAIWLRQMDIARPLLEESLVIFRELGSQRGEGQVLGSLGEIAQAEGDLERALDLYARSAEMVADLGITWWQAKMLAEHTDCALRLGRLEEAARSARESLVLARSIADRQGVVYALAGLTRVALSKHDLCRAGMLWGAVEAEESRGPLGAWESERDSVHRDLPHDDIVFAAGREQARRLSLDAAVDYALTSID